MVSKKSKQPMQVNKQSATLNEISEPNTTKNLILLYKKISAVQGDIGKVKKGGEHVDKSGRVQYKFGQIEDVVASVRQSAIEHGLLIAIDTISSECSYMEVKNKSGVTNVQVGKTRISMTLIDTDTGAYQETNWYGYSTDYSDKAIQKSYTSAVKYGYIENFLIAFGDNPEDNYKIPSVYDIMPKKLALYFQSKNAPESYVWEKIKEKKCDWPKMLKAIGFDEKDESSSQNADTTE